MLESPLVLGLIPGAPLLAALWIALRSRSIGRRGHIPCVLGLATSLTLAILVFLSKPAGAVVVAYDWVNLGSFKIPVAFQIDALTGVMLIVVNFVSFLVAIYAIGYMGHDPGYPRFFAEIALFVFSMNVLVLGGNFIMLFVGWELVGLCSYLLIGFWFEKPSAAAAARKAFLVNRIGDFGFILGVFLIWTTFGSLNYADTLGDPEALDRVMRQNPATLTWICLLLTAGAVGKSAQLPLHVWLPDAMEGPTPVSALIHAATMVTAGVYMVARAMPFFALAPDALMVVGALGGATALLAGLIALTQTDLKRVLAYSTVSQLGYMFLALGSAATAPKYAVVAVVAAIFHLFTHAFFKALLFLGAGSVMHSMGNVIDMRQFSGLRRVLPHTHWTFLCGTATLAGIPLLSGFWSKDEILHLTHEATHHQVYGAYFEWLSLAALGTAFLTAFYSFRAYFLTFWGEEKFPPEAGEHPHESPMAMLAPLMILSVFSLGIGLLVGPTHLFQNYLAAYLPTSEVHEGGGMDWAMVAKSSLLALAGAGLAFVFYGRRSSIPDRMRNVFPLLYDASLHKFYMDEIYQAFIVWPILGIASACRWIDLGALDRLVDGVASIPMYFSGVIQRIQNGFVQYYAMAMFMGLTLLLLMVLSVTGN